MLKATNNRDVLKQCDILPWTHMNSIVINWLVEDKDKKEINKLNNAQIVTQMESS